LWRRFSIDLHRVLARELNMTEAQLRELIRVAYAKVAEFQLRGVVHFHGIVRLDAPGERWDPPCIDIPTDTLVNTVGTAASRVRLVCGRRGA
jgi:replication initiator protein RepSA